jgi:hypothetical protein
VNFGVGGFGMGVIAAEQQERVWDQVEDRFE